jgi:hypothetical protein
MRFVLFCVRGFSSDVVILGCGGRDTGRGREEEEEEDVVVVLGLGLL